MKEQVPAGQQWRRRSLLTAAAVPLSYWLSGCSGDRSEPDTDQSPAPSSPSEPTATPDPVLALPATTPWVPLQGEVEPACKVTATDAVVTALSATARSPRVAVPPALQALAATVVPGTTSAVQVIYPQYGGLSTDRRLASIMLVADLLTLDASATEVGRTSMTLDVRLTRTGQSWSVTEVIVPTAREMSTAVGQDVAALLANPQVSIPGQARLDLAEGIVDPRVVQLLDNLSQQWRLEVQVFRTGHPVNVFDTDRVSNHTLGRAVDVWRLDQIPVVAHQQSPWEAVMRAAAAAGATEVGGPLKLDGRRPYFTDAVHQDHLHFGFD